MPKPNYKQSARDHLANAKKHLETEGEPHARYACLELRMCIEALTYLNLEAYLHEVPNTVMKKWTPKQVIDELLAVDPHADQSAHISVGIEDTPGVPSKNMRYLGQDKRLSIKWANGAHNALSNFLHEPTISSYELGQVKQEHEMRTKANEFIEKLDTVASSPLWGSNFGMFTTFSCKCGFSIKRKTDFLTPGAIVACGDRNCGRQYVYTSDPDGSVRFVPDRSTYTCENCKQPQSVDSHELKKLPVLTCSCGAKAQVTTAYELTKISQPSG